MPRARIAALPVRNTRLMKKFGPDGRFGWFVSLGFMISDSFTSLRLVVIVSVLVSSSPIRPAQRSSPALFNPNGTCVGLLQVERRPRARCFVIGFVAAG